MKYVKKLALTQKYFWAQCGSQDSPVCIIISFPKLMSPFHNLRGLHCMICLFGSFRLCFHLHVLHEFAQKH